MLVAHDGEQRLKISTTGNGSGRLGDLCRLLILIIFYQNFVDYGYFQHNPMFMIDYFFIKYVRMIDASASV